MKRLLALAVVAVPSFSFAAPVTLTEEKKLSICEDIAIHLDHDQEESEPWSAEACLASKFTVKAQTAADVEIEFVGTLVQSGAAVMCTIYNDKPLDKSNAYIENCDYLD